MRSIRITEYFRALVMSFEFVILVIGTLLLIMCQNSMESISSKLPTDQEVLKHLALLPSGFAAWVFVRSRELLFPEDGKGIILQQWPDYWRLKAHFHVSLLYTVLFAAIGSFVWVLGYSINEPIGFTLLLVSIVGGLVVASTVYLAKIRISEILIAGSQNDG